MLFVGRNLKRRSKFAVAAFALGAGLLSLTGCAATPTLRRPRCSTPPQTGYLPTSGLCSCEIC